MLSHVGPFPLIPRLIRPLHLRTARAVTGARGTKVWASLWTDRAVFSRAQANIPPAQARPVALAGFAGLRVPRTVVTAVVDETEPSQTRVTEGEAVTWRASGAP